MTEPITIIKLTRTCIACPSQWEGETSHGAAVYIRFRWGELTVHVGPSIDEAIDRPPVFATCDDGAGDSWMCDDRLRAALPPWIMIADGAITNPVTEDDLAVAAERTVVGLTRLIESGTVQVMRMETVGGSQ